MTCQNYNEDRYSCNEFDLEVKDIMLLKKHMIIKTIMIIGIAKMNETYKLIQ